MLLRDKVLTNKLLDALISSRKFTKVALRNRKSNAAKAAVQHLRAQSEEDVCTRSGDALYNSESSMRECAQVSTIGSSCEDDKDIHVTSTDALAPHAQNNSSEVVCDYIKIACRP